MDVSVVDVLATDTSTEKLADVVPPEGFRHGLVDRVRSRCRIRVGQGDVPELVGENVEVWPSPQLTVSINGPMPVMASAPRLIDVFTPAKAFCAALGAVRTGGTSRS